jgi:hypothetical protein
MPKSRDFIPLTDFFPKNQGFFSKSQRFFSNDWFFFQVLIFYKKLIVLWGRNRYESVIFSPLRLNMCVFFYIFPGMIYVFFGICLCLLLQFPDAWQWVRMVARVVVLWGRNRYENIIFPPLWLN